MCIVLPSVALIAKFSVDLRLYPLFDVWCPLSLPVLSIRKAFPCVAVLFGTFTCLLFYDILLYQVLA